MRALGSLAFGVTLKHTACETLYISTAFFVRIHCVAPYVFCPMDHAEVREHTEPGMERELCDVYMSSHANVQLLHKMLCLWYLIQLY